MCRAGFACLALAVPVFAQVEQPMGSFPHHHRQLSSEPETQPQPTPAAQAPPAAAQTPLAPPAAASAQSTPPSLLDKPAQPAKVDLASGQLAIHADNSSLTEILKKLTAESGMTVDGLGADQRIFGSYGPGDPQDVISTLLDGSGYNVLMLGKTAEGTPKQLTLSPRLAHAANGNPGRQQQNPAQDEDNDDEVQPPPQPPETPAPGPPLNPPGVRTPQQMLQELQQMRQQQQQQQQQQLQPQPPPQ